jgi:hypothetical protein
MAVNVMDFQVTADATGTYGSFTTPASTGARYRPGDSVLIDANMGSPVALTVIVRAVRYSPRWIEVEWVTPSMLPQGPSSDDIIDGFARDLAERRPA